MLKRVYSLLLVAILLFVFPGCGAKKFSGSYTHSEDQRYEFIIGDSARGEYGGTCNRYDSGRIISSHSWYIEDRVIYLDGEAWWNISDDNSYIYSFEPNIEKDELLLDYPETGNIYEDFLGQFGSYTRDGMFFKVTWYNKFGSSTYTYIMINDELYYCYHAV